VRPASFFASPEEEEAKMSMSHDKPSSYRNRKSKRVKICCKILSISVERAHTTVNQSEEEQRGGRRGKSQPVVERSNSFMNPPNGFLLPHFIHKSRGDKQTSEKNPHKHANDKWHIAAKHFDRKKTFIHREVIDKTSEKSMGNRVSLSLSTFRLRAENSFL
jgi:hypothetical protein